LLRQLHPGMAGLLPTMGTCLGMCTEPL
jgi:hypothetical protein